MTTFEIVKNLAEKQKISIVELEEKLGFSRNSLYAWKKSKPSVDKLQAVADYFHVSTDYLLGRTDNPKIANINTGTTDMAAHFRDGVTNLTPEQIEELDKLTNAIIEGYIAKNKKDK